MPEHDKLRRCWDHLRNRHALTGWDNWDHFQQDMPEGRKPGWYLHKKDPARDHGPGNSFFAPYRPNGGGSASRVPRFQMHKSGALIALFVTERSPIPVTPGAKVNTSEWYALCDCGRLCRVKGARFKKQGYCGHRGCEFKNHPKTYRGKQEVTKREQSAFLYCQEHRPASMSEPQYPLKQSEQRRIHEAGITFK